MNRWIALPAGLAASLLAAVGAVWVVGTRLPEDHTATVTARYTATPEDAWRAVTDLEHLAEWRSDVESVELSRTTDGRPAWTEIDAWGDRRAYEVVEARFPDHFVARVVGDDLPFGGTWTWRFASDGAGCAVTITEEGFVHPAMLRAIAYYAIGQDTSMRAALTDLGARLGQDAVFAP